jgi:DNA-binding NtrC family response regulator
MNQAGFDPIEVVEDVPDADVLGAVLREQWTLARLEKEYILGVLEATRGHRGRAAVILGIDRRTLYRKLRQYGARKGGASVTVLR